MSVMLVCDLRRAVALVVGSLAFLAPPIGAQGGPALRLVSGVDPSGVATEQWLAMVRKRLPDPQYDSVAPMRKRISETERAWFDLIASRVGAWEREIPRVAAPFQPILPPSEVLIVVGNRGAEDAFTHDPTTIGFDLAALQRTYGDAGADENADRVDRFFRHEYTHLMQKAWWVAHPYATDTPMRYALAEIWAEGMGNYYSLAPRWRTVDGQRASAAAEALALLEPRLVARLAALACASRDDAERLTADLSWGRFDRKWGALPTALWLEAEVSRSEEALRAFVTAGPDGVWALAERQLPGPVWAVMDEARQAEALCHGAGPSKD